MAYVYEHKKAPSWIIFLDEAEAWGVPPWQIVKGTTKTLWHARYTAVRDAKNKRAQKIKRDMERMNGG